MHFRSIRTAAVAVALMGAGLGAGAAIANPAMTAPTAAEKASIEASLKDSGFSSWQAVSHDGTGWKVDNAMAADGKAYDLTLDKTSFAVVSRQPDMGPNSGPQPK